MTRENEYPLFLQSGPAIVDSFGFGYCSFGPEAAWESWEIRGIQVINDGANPSLLKIFNNPTHTQLVEGTYAGRLATTDTRFNLRTGEKLYLRWEGATPGSRCTATVRGTKTVKVNY